MLIRRRNPNDPHSYSVGWVHPEGDWVAVYEGMEVDDASAYCSYLNGGLPPNLSVGIDRAGWIAGASDYESPIRMLVHEVIDEITLKNQEAKS